ncbi:MAG: hypothetical protein KGY99_04910 [Phycisphaerae bacterium]|nr:hypothetical protein [Phycisphaerae bacterium]
MAEPVRLNVSGPIVSVCVTGGEDGDAAADRSGQLTEQLETARAEMIQARDALLCAAAEIPALRQKALEAAEEQLVDLAVDIAAKVLCQQIQAQDYEIEPIVQDALRHVTLGGDVVVRLNPGDYANCSREDTDIPNGVTLMSDTSVAPAECRVETPGGIVESSVEGQLEHIREALKGSEAE